MRVFCVAQQQASSCSSSLGVLTSALPVAPPGAPTAKRCPAPRVRRALPTLTSEPVVELLVHADPYPSCLLPDTEVLSCRIDQGILPLVCLSKLRTRSLLRSLQEVETYVASTLSADQSVPSPLAYSPDFDAYLERALELAQRAHGTLGVAPFVLLLRTISHLRMGADPRLVASFTNYYQHFIVAFEDALDLAPESMETKEYVMAFEAWARIDLPVTPIKGHAFGSRLKALLSRSAFSTPQCAALLQSLAVIKARGSYRVCSYQLADLVSCLALRPEALDESTLLGVARAAAAFDWPAYNCLLPVLDAVCREAIVRELRGVAAARDVLGAAVLSAGGMRSRLGTELADRCAGWRAETAAAVSNGTASASA